MNFNQKIAVAIMDICLIAELCISMYFANLDPDNLTPLFMKYFFSMLIPTLILTKIAVRVLKTKGELLEPATGAEAEAGAR